MKTRKLQNDMYLETLDKRCSGYPIYKHRVKLWNRQLTWEFTDWATDALGTFCLWNHFNNGAHRLHNVTWPAWMIKYDTFYDSTEFYIREDAVSLVVLTWQE